MTTKPIGYDYTMERHKWRPAKEVRKMIEVGLLKITKGAQEGDQSPFWSFTEYGLPKSIADSFRAELYKLRKKDKS